MSRRTPPYSYERSVVVTRDYAPATPALCKGVYVMHPGGQLYRVLDEGDVLPALDGTAYIYRVKKPHRKLGGV